MTEADLPVNESYRDGEQFFCCMEKYPCVGPVPGNELDGIQRVAVLH